ALRVLKFRACVQFMEALHDMRSAGRARCISSMALCGQSPRDGRKAMHELLTGWDIVFFSAEWSEPCIKMRKILDDLGVQYLRVNTDTPDLKCVVDHHNVSAIPTLMVRGTKLVGLRSPEVTKDFINA